MMSLSRFVSQDEQTSTIVCNHLRNRRMTKRSQEPGQQYSRWTIIWTFFVVVVLLNDCSLLRIQSCEAAFPRQQQSSNNEYNKNDREILPASGVSYVMEPFESIDPEWFAGNTTSLRVSTDALYGNYSIQAYSSLSSSTIIGGSNTSTSRTNISFGWIMTERPHNCYGAHYFSLWYKIIPSRSSSTSSSTATTSRSNSSSTAIASPMNQLQRIRLNLYDDTNCIRRRTTLSSATSTILDCSDPEEYNIVDQSILVYSNNKKNTNDWQEIQIPLIDLSKWNMRRIRGWKIEVLEDGEQTQQNTTTTTTPATNANIPFSIQFDQLACVGDGSLFGNMFHIGSPLVSLDEVFQPQGSWQNHYYESNISQRDTSVSLNHGVLSVNYTVQQVEDWGGFVDYAYLAPGPAYYNLSQATDIAFHYTVPQISSRTGRAIVRFVLQDNSNCNETCDTDYHSQERYYSFHSILDTTNDNGQIVIALNASTIEAVPFFLPGWSGILGNELLDITNLKGFTLEVVLDTGLTIGELVTGAVTFRDLQAVVTVPLSSGYVEMSYVMEPFESMHIDWLLPASSSVTNRTKDSLQLTIFNQSLFGNYSLLAEYDVSDPATSMTSAAGGSVSFGWILADRPHSCYGAKAISIWYKIPSEAKSMKGAVRLRVLFFDDSDCEKNSLSLVNISLCSDPDNLTPYIALDESLDTNNNNWNELSKALLPDVINLRRIRGWMIQILHDNQSEPNVNVSDSSGTILLDQLSCFGGGDIFGAAFHIDPSFSMQRSISEGTWQAHYYESNISARDTSSSLIDGVLSVNYTVEMAEDWGGFVDFPHLAPGAAYYNLSTLATDVTLNYVINQAASKPGRALFRFVLQDNSNCNETCDTDYHSQERYYSFFSILDINSSSPVEGQLVIALNASTEAAVPFWLTGWSGILGNEQLDITNLKGYTLEMVLDDTLKLGDLVSGSVAFKDLKGVSMNWNNTENDTSADAVREPGLLLNAWAPQFNRIEFFSSECADRCAEAADCLYAMSDGVDCYMAPFVAAEDVGLLNTDLKISSLNSYWMDDIVKRGSYCQVCACHHDNLTIDCRGRDLAIVPKGFEETWEPRSLDLRDNPRLSILGSEQLASVNSSLQELWLPVNISFISSKSLNDLPSNLSIYFQGRPTIQNGIIDQHDAFGDICCSKGEHVDLKLPTSGLTFCDMHVDVPGIDSVFLPFFNYIDATLYQYLYPKSPFMSEAAENAEKCSQYCSIITQCRYFTYDDRLPNSFPVCNLLNDNGTRQERVCCSTDQYADENKTKPGYTSGYPPSTRRFIDNATVWSSPQKLTVNPINNYTAQYILVLGSTPLRGAVWVEPVLASPVTDMNISISPQRAVLYNSNMSVTVTIKVSGLTPRSTGKTLVVNNKILSCDVAFMPPVDSNVFIDVETPPPPPVSNQTNSKLALAIALPATVVALIAIGLLACFERNRRANDSIWQIKMNELKFASPPEVIGRGTFGLVLLGEYRGTQVAVKRAIPPRIGNKKDGAVSRSDQIEASFGGTTIDEMMPLDGKGTDGSISNTDDYSTSRSNEKKGNSNSVGMSSWGGMSFGSQQGGMNNSLNRNQKSSHSARESIFSSANEASLQRKLRADFVEEMRYLSKLRHPCITTVMGAVVDRNVEPMLVMEYMDHGSLYDMLHNETMILEGEVILPILRDVAKGVRFLHAANPMVIHGDLKAQNILVDSKLRAKVSDFGLSQKRNLGGTGTPFWMAPELLRGDTKNTTASDIYSFGIILYEAFSRRDPYEGEDAKEVLRLVTDKAVNKRPPVPPSSPTQIQSLMADCLQGDPLTRPSAEEIDSRLLRIDLQNMDIGQGGGLKAKKSAVSLFDIFPRHIAEALRDGKKVEPEQKDMVTIFFSDIVGFTNISSTLDPRKIAALLDRLYLKFDELSRKHDVFKLETIGDAYVAATNLVSEQHEDHCKRIAAFALEAIQAANETVIDEDDPDRGVVNIRVGFHSGPVVADVVGNRNPRYCLFGDTMNIASRMESNSKENRIHCSARSAELLRVQWPDLPLLSRGEINIKGKGIMHTYWVNENERRKSAKLDLLDPELLKTLANATSTSIFNIETVLEEEGGCVEGESEGFVKDSKNNNNNKKHDSQHLEGAGDTSEELDTVRNKLNERFSKNVVGNEDNSVVSSREESPTNAEQKEDNTNGMNTFTRRSKDGEQNVNNSQEEYNHDGAIRVTSNGPVLAASTTTRMADDLV